MNKPNITETLTREGIPIKGNKALCPIHDDKNPSLAVYPVTNTFHCFGCGEHGDSIDFIMKYRGMTFKEALKYLSIDGYRPQQISGIAATERVLIERFRQWESEYHAELCTEYRSIQNYKSRVTSIDDIDPAVYQAEPLIEYRLDILTYGDDRSRFNLYQEVLKNGH